ncbi:MAG: prepilin-type N-terminal cleavage/methylation domain-containing protein [Phycisphaeraceae bacterium]|nr:MAG: prepilin-type N-terminal cleavage/methylation domain-containing protein [Phycisphaeraceae bacterium]
MFTATTRRVRKAFSMIEMLIALAITGTLLTAALAALDASFKSYQYTTDGASTHVVSRIVMHRLTGLIRTGDEFAPYPVDPTDPAQNPIVTDGIEFRGYVAPDADFTRVIRIERRSADDPDRPNTFELWYTQEDYRAGSLIASDSRPMITNLHDIQFTLEYDVGPRLKRATIDMTVRPNDIRSVGVYTDVQGDTVRFVSSVFPRRLMD